MAYTVEKGMTELFPRDETMRRVPYRLFTVP